VTGRWLRGPGLRDGAVVSQLAGPDISEKDIMSLLAAG
jgi:hypothetical protein